MDLVEEVRAALADGEPLGDPEARDLLVRLLEAYDGALERLEEADLPARREEAAELVAEARRARDRILRDLARRRHEARREVAQLQAGRDRLLETFASIRGTVDASTRELNLALAEARLRAGEAGREIDREDLPTAAALDAELELARLAKLPLVAPEEPDEGAASGAADPDDGPATRDGGTDDATAADGATAADEAATDEPAPAVDEPTTPPGEASAGDDGSVPVDDAPGAPPGEASGEPTTRRVREPVAALVEDRDVEPEPEPDAEPEPSEVELVEQRAAQRLKRVLADEQNEVLDRLRQRDRRRRLTVDHLLGGDLERIARYRDALVAVLADAGDEPDRAATVASDAAEAIVRGTRTRVEGLLEEAVEGRTVDEDRVVDGVRACFREWKTQWLVRLAADSVALATAADADTG